MAIRRATVVDAQAIAALNTRAWKQCFAGVLPAAFLDRYTDPGARRRLTSPLPGSVQHVHEHAGEVTGWLWTLPCPDPDLDSATAYEVKGCYVHPDRWRTGVGRLLINYAVELATVGGRRQVTLWTPEGAAKSRRFYEALGFTPDGGPRRRLDVTRGTARSTMGCPRLPARANRRGGITHEGCRLHRADEGRDPGHRVPGP